MASCGGDLGAREGLVQTGSAAQWTGVISIQGEREAAALDGHWGSVIGLYSVLVNRQACGPGTKGISQGDPAGPSGPCKSYSLPSTLPKVIIRAGVRFPVPRVLFFCYWE